LLFFALSHIRKSFVTRRPTKKPTRFYKQSETVVVLKNYSFSLNSEKL
jgi:hypothetical protein